jgi:hypothetical protein
MGTFATLTDVASEIKAAAEAEVTTPGSGAELVSFTDAAAVTTAVAAAVIEVETYVVEAAAIASGQTPEAAAAAAAAAAEASAVAAAAEAVAEAAAAELAAAAEAAAAEAEALAAVAVAEAQKGYFMITGLNGASWDGPSVANQNLDSTFAGGRFDVTTDIQVPAADFTAAFDESAVDTMRLGGLSIGNLTAPTKGMGNDQEVTIVITDTTSDNMITVGFTVDWGFSGNNFTFSSDDSTVDVSVVQRGTPNTALGVTINNGPMTNSITIVNDGEYGGRGQPATLNINALELIKDLNASTGTTFDILESKFAVAGAELDVAVDVSNLGVYYGTSQVTSITSTIDIV